MESIYSTGDMAKIYSAIFKSLEEITDLMRYEPISKTTTKNDFGEEQLNVDKETDEIIYKNLKESGVVYNACSEESIHPQVLNEGGSYTVCFDPLDGSSIVDANFAVGSIFGIWPKTDLIGESCRKMVGACLGVYGTKTVALVYNQDKDEIDELTYRRIEGQYKWVVTEEGIKICEGDANTFAPGNLRVTKELPGYKHAIDWFIENGKKLRYSGGMAPDVYHIFHKKEGVFLYPGIKEKKIAKLRVLYECAPIAFLIEKAGGMATDGHIPILDLVVDGYEMRTPVYLGSKSDIERVDKFIKEAEEKGEQAVDP
uniref:Sedoheptulose-1,7-bisphosphatase n=1 Tax=Cardiosporidium cionae TaxID=476202 RepID=A0A3Q8UBI9_9APIC|nr:sedoheptulose-1,7-bisphosphatase [Cardiosporidium cionae]